MRNLFYILAISGLCFSACSTTNQECGDLICTQEFRTVQVKFKDASGNLLTAKDFSAVIKRTNKSVVPYNDSNSQGTYYVASDADLRELSERGEVILVSATHPQTAKKTVTEFVVSGGICACHIAKVSGPEEIIL